MLVKSQFGSIELSIGAKFFLQNPPSLSLKLQLPPSKPVKRVDCLKENPLNNLYCAISIGLGWQKYIFHLHSLYSFQEDVQKMGR